MDLNAFLDKSKCDRCGQDMMAKTMSYFNTDTICLNCSEEEKSHPLYEQAKNKDHQEFQDGNYFYDGLYAGTDFNDIPRE